MNYVCELFPHTMSIINEELLLALFSAAGINCQQHSRVALFYYYSHETNSLPEMR